MKTNIFFFIAFLLCNNIIAQFEPYSNFKTRHFEDNWSFGLGLNIVDDSGNKLQNFDINEYSKNNWAFSSPISFSAEYHFNIDFSIIGIVAFNKFKEGIHRWLCGYR